MSSRLCPLLKSWLQWSRTQRIARLMHDGGTLTALPSAMMVCRRMMLIHIHPSLTHLIPRRSLATVLHMLPPCCPSPWWLVVPRCAHRRLLAFHDYLARDPFTPSSGGAPTTSTGGSSSSSSFGASPPRPTVLLPWLCTGYAAGAEPRP